MSIDIKVCVYPKMDVLLYNIMGTYVTGSCIVYTWNMMINPLHYNFKFLCRVFFKFLKDYNTFFIFITVEISAPRINGP